MGSRSERQEVIGCHRSKAKPGKKKGVEVVHSAREEKLLEKQASRGRVTRRKRSASAHIWAIYY